MGMETAGPRRALQYSTRATSVRERSSPSNSRGSPEIRESAHAQQSPRLRFAGCLPLPNFLQASLATSTWDAVRGTLLKAIR